MDLKSLISSTKTIEVEFPGMDGFVLTLNYISKEEVRKITEKCRIMKFDKKTRQPIDGFDGDLFVKLYTAKVLTGWVGLKYSYLKELLVLQDLPDGELEYSEENAHTLVTASSTFDEWLNATMSDVSLFNKDS